MWLGQLAERNAQCFPNRTAVVDEYRSVTWAEFATRCSELARGLADRGVRTGDRVAILSRDRVEVLESYVALSLLGALFVPLNHSLTGEEVDDCLHRVGADAMLGEGDLLARHDRVHLRLRLAVDDSPFAELGRGSTTVLPEVPDDVPAAILHTSATTGRAKGVTVDENSFRAIALGWLTLADAPEDMVLVNCCPLYHGSMVVSLTYMAAGATIVLLGGFSPQKALAAVATHRATHLWLVPQMLRFLLAAGSFGTTDLATLREILYGAAPMPPEIYREAAQRIGCGFRQVYGMTEVGGPFVTLGPDQHPDPTAPPEIIPAGRVIPGMSVRVLDPDGQQCPSGTVGEIGVRGPGTMVGYWNDPEATAATRMRGWTLTGDLGLIDDNGFIQLVDRTKDLIIRAGQNVYPAEVERALRSHPDVVDAAVIGVPDEDYGELPLAYVVRRGSTTTAELLGYLAGRLAPYKRPRRIEFIDEVPRNPAGKILKKSLRA